MGKSFFNGSTDSALAMGSRAFAKNLSQSPETYGISEELAAAYVALDAQWQAAYSAAALPGSRTSSEVSAKNELRRQITAMASSLASMIAGNPAVSDGQRLGLGLSVRAKASPLPEPGQPWGLEKTLDGDGSLILTWKCDNPKGSRGTQYELWRQIAGEPFAFLTMVGVKTYRDHSLPVGASGIIYKIRAVRSTKSGQWTLFPVNFGGGRPNMMQMAA